MPSTPPSVTTSASSATRSPEPRFRVVRKRNRVPLSCHPCRTRKKCDRSHPCSNCVKREGPDTASCSYATPVTRRKNLGQGEPSPDEMQSRIDRLEGLVLSLMHGGANIDLAASSHILSVAGGSRLDAVSGTDTNPFTKRVESLDNNIQEDEESDIDDSLAHSLGCLKVDPIRSKHVYLGEEHWHTILLDIAEVKNYFANHKRDLERSYERIKLSKPPTAKQPPTLLMGAIPATEDELRAELPPKSTVLALCSRYFSSMDSSINIVHAPTFYRQLQGHWNDPSKTPIMWMALLYAILCLAMLSYIKVGDEPPEWKGRALELADEYRLRTVQCLIAGDYTKPTAYTVESMLLYTFCEYFSRWDADLGLWHIIAMTVRTALRMGYHRDGKWFPTLSPFEAEMRRRTWALVRMIDVCFSHRISLPNMLSDNDYDTELPHNLYDEDFGPDTKALPPSRPLSDPTRISFMIYKVKLCLQLGTILQITSRVKNQVHYDEILRLDARLRETRAEIPPHLKLQPLDGSKDPLPLIMARFNIDILYLKIMCLLHRKYVPRARNNPKYAHSRRSAIQASLDTLRHLATIYRESQPGGVLSSARWYFATVATKDFLLPAMLIALDLHFDNVAQKTDGKRGSSHVHFWTREQREEMIKHLELTKDIEKGLADTSMEALKAANTLEIMLDKIKNAEKETNTGPLPESDVKIEQQPGHMTVTALSMPIDEVVHTQTSGFDSLQNSLGITYGGPDPGFSITNAGLHASTSFNYDSNTGGLPLPDYSTTALGVDTTRSPLTAVLDNMAGGAMDFSGNLDWDSFENYTQTAHWGTESLQFFSGNPDQALQETVPSSTMFSCSLDLMGPS